MILGFTFSGFTPGMERYEFWSHDESASKMIDAIRSAGADPTVLNNSSFGLPLDGGELFRIRRIYANDSSLIWIGVYKHAYSTHRARSGGYMSVGIWLADALLLGDVLLESLKVLTEILSNACLNTSGEFHRPLAEMLPAENERLLFIMKELSKGLAGLPPASSFVEGPTVFDFSAAKEDLPPFFATCLLILPSQLHRSDVYFFFSGSVSDVLKNRRAIQIVNHWQLINDALDALKAVEAKDMNQAAAGTGTLPDILRPSDAPSLVPRGSELGEVLSRLKAIETTMKDLKSFNNSQKDINKRLFSSAKSTRLLGAGYLSFSIVMFAVMTYGYYILNLKSVLFRFP
jgi:hypothetical protein